MDRATEETQLIHNTTQRLTSAGWQIVGIEWEPLKGKSQFGRGDILATREDLVLAVECKHINSTNSTKKRKKVKDQAEVYAAFAKLRTIYKQKRVRGCWVTNENQGFTRELTCDDAQRVLVPYLQNRGLISSMVQNRGVSSANNDGTPGVKSAVCWARPRSSTQQRPTSNKTTEAPIVSNATPVNEGMGVETAILIIIGVIGVTARLIALLKK